MRNVFLLFMIVFLPANLLRAETSWIKGRAKGYENREISAMVHEDHLSEKLKKIAQSKISDSGTFELKLDISDVQEVILRIDGVSTFLFIQPGTTYEVEIPDLDGKVKNFMSNQVEILFDSLPPRDINLLILDFDERLDAFVGKNYLILGSQRFKIELDTFRNRSIERYRSIDNSYFRNYVMYSIAALEQIGGVNTDMRLLKGMVFRDYLSERPLLYHHSKYMLFFKQFFTDVFKLTDKEQEIELIKAINYKASPKAVMKVLAVNPFLSDERFRELVMLKALTEEYHTGDYYQEQIVKIIDSVKYHSSFSEHRLIANNLLESLTQVTPGFDAPDFDFTDQNGEKINLSALKGKYIYLQFWASWNVAGVTEMKLMPELYKKYGKDIAFVSVNMDEDPMIFEQFKKDHPEMKWHMVHYSEYPEVIEDYLIRSLPLFYLIGPEGKFVQAPAHRPTPSGNLVTIEETFYSIYRNLNPRGKLKAPIPGIMNNE